MKSIHLRVDHADPGHVHFTVFIGEKDCTRANCGSLCMSPLEYSIFSLLLQAGSITAPDRAEVTYDVIKPPEPLSAMPRNRHAADRIREWQDDMPH